jgi:DNA-binding NtrC family response regulator
MVPKRSVLVVDDESGVREAIRIILKPQYTIYTAADGNEALQCIQKNKIDIVTLDLKMPGLSGFEVLQQIKKSDADIEVIVISAYGTPQNHQEAILHGAGDFIIKPFNASDLINSVCKSLERRTQNLRLRNLARYNSSVVVMEEDPLVRAKKVAGLGPDEK